MPYDYTDAPPPRDIELIPHGTIATVVLHIRAGNVGEDGKLKRSAKGDCEMLVPGTSGLSRFDGCDRT
jgi:hypothetical protein